MGRTQGTYPAKSVLQIQLLVRTKSIAVSDRALAKTKNKQTNNKIYVEFSVDGIQAIQHTHKVFRGKKYMDWQTFNVQNYRSSSG